MDIEGLVEENRRRHEALHAPFDPLTGEGSPGERREVRVGDLYPYAMRLPLPMLRNRLARLVVKAGSIRQFCMDRYGECSPATREKAVRAFVRVRCKHDFPFYAYAYNEIKNKEGGRNVHFRLTFPQRRLLSVLEGMRLEGKPIRVILLKARQWGGSTLIQLYIAWIQLMHREGWYSAIVAQDASTSRVIKAMYSKMLERFPPWLIRCPDGAKLAFTPYEGSQLDSIITYGKGTNTTRARDTVIKVGTYNNTEAGRGGDIACVHYSEVGLWQDTEGKKPEDVIRSISSSLLMAPLTVEVIESTANGMGNFFYRAYQEAKQGRSNRQAVFIPWFMIEKYEAPVGDGAAFARWLLACRDNPNPPPGCLDPGAYYWRLWTLGATFQAIRWYAAKRKDYIDHQDMMAEFPSDDVEAFRNSGRSVFSAYQLDKLGATCRPPLRTGEVQGGGVQGKAALQGLHFADDPAGLLRVWSLPQEGGRKVARRYLVAVDVGGRGKGADWSDILVIDRYWMMHGGSPEVVAEWHGHTDHDLLAWKAAQVAAFYHNALLVIESNTIETRDDGTDGDQSELIFSRIAGVYPNLYLRRAPEAKVREGVLTEYGFHTNRKTKPMIISNLVACVRDLSYIEREAEAVAEMAVYERKDNGAFGAADNCHDDRVMARAIALHVCFNEMDPPAPARPKPRRKPGSPMTEASI